jgi:glucokinase
VTTLLADLGGTRLKCGLSPDAVDVVEHGGRWLQALRDAVARTGADEVALCVPGLVDDGRVVALPGKLPGLENAYLPGALGVGVSLVVNDAIAYGIGEAVVGAGAGHGRVVVVTLGTGVGVAVVEDGAPLGRGALGGGLLGGQLPIAATSPTTDTSGRTGTFEACCRADALVAAVPEARDVAGAYARLTAGQPDAVAGFAAFRAHLVRGLTALALAHAPSCVVVGGGAAQEGLLDGVDEALAGALWAGQSVEVRRAALGDAAALTGLAVLLRARVSA